MTRGTLLHVNCLQKNGKMTGHNNTDVSTKSLTRVSEEIPRKVEMNESGPQAQGNRAITSGAAAFLGDKNQNDYLVIYSND